MPDEKPISRRHFLKLIGYLGVVSLGGLGALRELYQNGSPSLLSASSPLVTPNSVSPPLLQTAFAQTTGSWSLGQNTTVVAILAALTSTGKIFYIAGSSYCINTASGPYAARLLDPTTGIETNVALSNDLFCSGAAQLPNGNIFVCGGTKLYDIDVNNCNGQWHGGNYAYEFDITSGTLIQQNPMKQGRWYPTCVSLPNGKVLIVAGDDEYGGYNFLTEIYDPTTKSFSISYNPLGNGTYCVGSGAISSCPGAGTPCYGGPNQGVAIFLALYPRMSLMPSGLVFASGSLQKTYLWDPSSGVWTFVNSTSQTYRDYGTSILLPLQNTSNERGKVIIVGGSTTGSTAATNVVEIEDFNQGTSTAPVLRTVASLNIARKFLLPIILPNGKVVVFGGSSQGTTNPIYIPEMFDPENESQGWVTLPAATVARVYHATALLLPDGSVWTASSTVNACTPEFRTEIFKPAYFSATRPTISGTAIVGGYGQSITIPTPNPSSISRVSLVRLGATTHHYEANARLIWLQIGGTSSNSITVSAPLNANLAPPGYYMIHVLDSSLVPSTAQIIQIPGTGVAPPPARVTGLSATAAGSAQINLAWTANTDQPINHYNIYRSTTNGFTVNTATDTPIATPTTNSYSDTGLTASTTYYYVVAAVNSSSIIGPVSAQASAQTLVATAPAQVTGLTVTTPTGTTYVLNLSWTANTDQPINHYNIYRSTTNGFTVNTATDTPIATPTTNSYSDTGLTFSTKYYYVVAAVNSSSIIGPVSSQASGTTVADTTIPMILITSPANHATVPHGSILVQGTSSDDLGGSGVKNVLVLVDTGATILPYATATPFAPGNWSTWSITLNIPTTGSQRILARATDNAGKQNWNNITITTATAPAQVTGLSATAAGSTQINLAWTANTDQPINQYDIYRSTTNGFTVNTATDTPIATPTTNSYSDTGLTASTTYYYVVAAVNNSSIIGPVSAQASAQTGSTAPAQVTGLSATAAGSTQINLAWTANTDQPINQYDIYRSTTNGFTVNTATDTPIATPTTNSYSDTGLTASTTYYYVVAAVNNSSIIGPVSAQASAQTGSTAPAQVTGLSATAAGSTQINLAWTANTDQPINHYNIYRSTTNGFTVNTATDTPIATPTTNSYSDTGLTASTTYYYVVAAVNNSSIIGPVSAQASAQTGSTAPAQVTGLSATAAGSTQINLAWTANTDQPINHYNIYRSTTNGFTVNTATDTPIATPTTNSYSDTGLTASTTYYYVVAAVNNSSIIGPVSAQASAQTGSTAPAQVTGLSATAAGSTQINLAWTANTDQPINHYNIYRSTTNGFTVNTATDTPIATPTTNSYSDTGLTASTTYYYVVAAVNNSSIIGPVSAQASAQTGSTAPAQVTGLSATAAGSTQINLAWTANTDQPINHYNIYRSTTNGFTVNTATDTPIATPTTNSYSDTGLTASTTYYYVVAAVNNSSIIGPVSAQASAQTGSTAPAQVTGLSATAAGSTQINLAWTANTNQPINQYDIYRSTTNGFTVNTATDTPIATPTTNSYSDTGLTASTTYYYVVAAVNNSSIIGPVSAQASAQTGSTAPAQVTGLTVTTPTGTTYVLNLSWTANTDQPINHYNIYRSTTNGFTVNTATDTPIATPTTNSYSDTGLTASTKYYYVVAAVNSSSIIGPVSSQASGTTVADTTIPMILITSPANNARLPHGSILVQGTSSDDLGGSGVKNVLVLVDTGATILPYATATPFAPGNWSTWSITLNIPTTGSQRILARATDNAGKQNWNSIKITTT